MSLSKGASLLGLQTARCSSPDHISEQDDQAESTAGSSWPNDSPPGRIYLAKRFRSLADIENRPKKRHHPYNSPGMIQYSSAEPAWHFLDSYKNNLNHTHSHSDFDLQRNMEYPQSGRYRSYQERAVYREDSDGYQESNTECEEDSAENQGGDVGYRQSCDGLGISFSPHTLQHPSRGMGNVSSSQTSQPHFRNGLSTFGTRSHKSSRHEILPSDLKDPPPQYREPFDQMLTINASPDCHISQQRLAPNVSSQAPANGGRYTKQAGNARDEIHQDCLGDGNHNYSQHPLQQPYTRVHNRSLNATDKQRLRSPRYNTSDLPRLNSPIWPTARMRGARQENMNEQNAPRYSDYQQTDDREKTHIRHPRNPLDQGSSNISYRAPMGSDIRISARALGISRSGHKDKGGSRVLSTPQSKAHRYSRQAENKELRLSALEDDGTPLESLLHKQGGEGAVKFNQSRYNAVKVLPQHGIYHQNLLDQIHNPHPNSRPNHHPAASGGGPNSPIDLLSPESNNEAPFSQPSIRMKGRLPLSTTKTTPPGILKLAKPNKKNEKVMLKEKLPLIDPELARQKQIAQYIINIELKAKHDQLETGLFGEIVGAELETYGQRSQLQPTITEQRGLLKETSSIREAIETEAAELALKHHAERQRILKEQEEKGKKAKREANRKLQAHIDNEVMEEKRRKAQEKILTDRQAERAKHDAKASEREKVNIMQVEQNKLIEIKLRQEAAKLQAASLKSASIFPPNGSKKDKRSSLQISDDADETLFVVDDEEREEIYDVDERTRARLLGPSNAAELFASIASPWRGRKSVQQEREEYLAQKRAEDERKRLESCAKRLDALRKAKAAATPSNAPRPSLKKPARRTNPKPRIPPKILCSAKPRANASGSTTKKYQTPALEPFRQNTSTSGILFSANAQTEEHARQPLDKNPALHSKLTTKVISPRHVSLQEFSGDGAEKERTSTGRRRTRTLEQKENEYKRRIEKGCEVERKRIIKEAEDLGYVVSDEQLQKRVDGYRKIREDKHRKNQAAISRRDGSGGTFSSNNPLTSFQEFHPSTGNTPDIAYSTSSGHDAGTQPQEGIQVENDAAAKSEQGNNQHSVLDSKQIMIAMAAKPLKPVRSRFAHLIGQHKVSDDWKEDTDSDESEEDPDDEDTLESYIAAHNRGKSKTMIYTPAHENENTAGQLVEEQTATVDAGATAISHNAVPSPDYYATQTGVLSGNITPSSRTFNSGVSRVPISQPQPNPSTEPEPLAAPPKAWQINLIVVTETFDKVTSAFERKECKKTEPQIYTDLMTANDEACEYFCQYLKPPRPLMDHMTRWQQDFGPKLREFRDVFREKEAAFDVDIIEKETGVPWLAEKNVAMVTVCVEEHITT